MKDSQPRIFVDDILPELVFSTSRSSGPGGQSVNKLNTKVTLRWDVVRSATLSEDQRAIIVTKLAKVINKDGEVILSAERSRSQLQNKEDVLGKLDSLLKRAFTVPKVRKATKPTKSSIKKRLASKKKLSEKKSLRKKLED